MPTATQHPSTTVFPTTSLNPPTAKPLCASAPLRESSPTPSGEPPAEDAVRYRLGHGSGYGQSHDPNHYLENLGLSISHWQRQLQNPPPTFL